MDLRLPDSGSWLLALVSSPGPAGGAASDLVTGVTPAQLDAALSALQRGEIEYLILEDGSCFLQVAGEGAGPYQVEVAFGDETMHRLDLAADPVVVGRIMHAYLLADPAWRDGPWTPPLDGR